MKLLRTALLIATIMMFWTVTSHAIPIDLSGDFGQATLVNGEFGTTAGGEFLATVTGGGGDSNGSPAPNTYITFCVEYNEHIAYNTPYDIESVEDYAVEGGVGHMNAAVGTELGASSDTQDFLSTATQWLFWNYLNDISVLGYSARDNTIANYVQKSIWYLENEINDFGTDTEAQAFYDNVVAANYDVAGRYDISGQVKVMNLITTTSTGKINRQSQLVANPVPEPGTILLIGLGLFGIATVNRKKFFKKS